MAVIDARPTTVDLNLYAGDDVTLEIDVTDNAGAPFDLTGYTAAAQLRATATDPTSVDFTATAVANKITLTLPGADSATLPVKGVWDVQVTSGTGVITTLAGGKFTMTPGVTQ